MTPCLRILRYISVLDITLPALQIPHSGCCLSVSLDPQRCLIATRQKSRRRYVTYRKTYRKTIEKFTGRGTYHMFCISYSLTGTCSMRIGSVTELYKCCHLLLVLMRIVCVYAYVYHRQHVMREICTRFWLCSKVHSGLSGPLGPFYNFSFLFKQHLPLLLLAE